MDCYDACKVIGFSSSTFRLLRFKCHFARFITWLSVSIIHFSYTNIPIYQDLVNHRWLTSRKSCQAFSVVIQNPKIWKAPTHQRYRRYKATLWSGRGNHRWGKWWRIPAVALNRRCEDVLSVSQAWDSVCFLQTDPFPELSCTAIKVMSGDPDYLGSNPAPSLRSCVMLDKLDKLDVGLVYLCLRFPSVWNGNDDVQLNCKIVPRLKWHLHVQSTYNRGWYTVGNQLRFEKRYCRVVVLESKETG